MEGKEIKFNNQIEKEKSFEVETLLKKLFESEKAVKTNEGHNGIILEINLDELTEEERDSFCSYFNIEYKKGESKAIKMIKVFQPEKVEKEFSAQVKASRVINDNDSINGDIGVPECYFGGELTIGDSEVKERLSNYGIHFTDNRLGLMMMDYIEGEDLGIYCYKQFIKLNFDKFKEFASIEVDVSPDEYDLYLNGLSINDLVLACHKILDIRAKYHYFDDSYEARVERSQIAEIILGALENKAFLEKRMVQSLRRAIDIMHENNIYHRDLHPRNLIKGRDGKMYIVDFGSAKTLSGNVTDFDLKYIYQSDDGKLMQADEAILFFLDKMAVTPEEHEKEENRQRLKNAFEIRDFIFDNQDSKKLNRIKQKIIEAKSKLEKSAKDNLAVADLIKSFSHNLGVYSGDQYFDYQITGLMVLLELGYKNDVSDFCYKLIDDDEIKQSFLSKINSFIKYFDI